jgi:hypothetical protein
MSAYQMPCRSISADDPIEVWAVGAAVLAAYSNVINRNVEDMLAEFPDADDFRRLAKAYINKLGENLPDETIRAALKKLAANKFRGVK